MMLSSKIQMIKMMKNLKSITPLFVSGVMAIVASTQKTHAVLPYHDDFSNFSGWSIAFNSGTGASNTADAVDGKLVVTASHTVNISNARINAYATGTGSDFNFYQQPITIKLTDVSFATTSNGGNAINRRALIGINSRDDRWFFTGTQPSNSIYLYMTDEQKIYMGYNRNIADDPNPPADNSRPNNLAELTGAFSQDYDSISITLDGQNWKVTLVYKNDLQETITSTFNGTLPTASNQWLGTGDAFFLTVGAEALNSTSVESTTFSIGSITVIPEASTASYAISMLFLVALIQYLRKRR